MTTTEKQLLNALKRIVKHEEATQRFTLCKEDRECFIEGWHKFLHQACTKFIAGAREHADEKWSAVNFAREERNEIIDLCHYQFGKEKFKHNTNTKI